MSKTKRFLAILCTIAMLFSGATIVSLHAYASETEGGTLQPEGLEQEIVKDETSEKESALTDIVETKPTVTDTAESKPAVIEAASEPSTVEKNVVPAKDKEPEEEEKDVELEKQTDVEKGDQDEPASTGTQNASGAAANQSSDSTLPGQDTNGALAGGQDSGTPNAQADGNASTAQPDGTQISNGTDSGTDVDETPSENDFDNEDQKSEGNEDGPVDGIEKEPTEGNQEPKADAEPSSEDNAAGEESDSDSSPDTDVEPEEITPVEEPDEEAAAEDENKEEENEKDNITEVEPGATPEIDADDDTVLSLIVPADTQYGIIAISTANFTLNIESDGNVTSIDSSVMNNKIVVVALLDEGDYLISVDNEDASTLVLILTKKDYENELTELVKVKKPETPPTAEAENVEAEAVSSEPEEDNNAYELPENAKVDFDIFWDDQPALGATAHFRATVTGLEEYSYSIQWQYSEDGERWSNIPDATDLDMDMVATEENCMYQYRVKVRLAEEAEPQAEE